MSFETLVLNNIEVLGYNHQNNFFGEKSFHYSTTKTLSIRGYVLDLTNAVGVKDILLDTGRIKDVAENFQNVIINGVNFGIGKFTSLSFDAGNWVRSTQFNADIEIYQTANLQSLVSKEFTGVNILNKRFDLIKSFSETFDLDFDQNTKILGGTHSIEIEYGGDNKDISVIALAQSLASELLKKSIPTNLSEYNYAIRQEGSYKVLNSESYDIINGKCGFTKTFSYSTNDNLKPYSANRNSNISIETDGIVTITETCSIKAENDNPSLYENALIGLNQEIDGAYSRCNAFFEVYKNKFQIIDPLNTNTLERSININKFDGVIEYTVTFNNDKKTAGNYIFEYTSTLDRSESFIWTVSERGSVIGIGDPKYSSAEAGWSIQKNNIQGRLTTFWTNGAEEKASNNINLITKEISRSPFKGQITYNYAYTDDPTIRTDLGDIKKLEIEYSDDGGAGDELAPIFKEFVIPNRAYTLVQNRNFLQQGTFSISAKAEIATNNVFNGLSYFETLKTQVRNAYVGGDIDKYLESAKFSSDELEQNVSYEETYKYS